MKNSHHEKNDEERSSAYLKNEREGIDSSSQVSQREDLKLYESWKRFLSTFDQSEEPEVKAEQLAHGWVYDNIDEVTRNCRKIYFIYLSLLSYSLLTAFTTPAQDLFFGQDVKLPFIDATVSLQYFTILIPLIAIGLFVYNQLYLVKVYKLINFAIDECSEANPNCKQKPKGKECDIDDICVKHQNRLYPWMIIFSRYSEEKIVGNLQRIFVKFTIWGFLPTVLIAFSLFVIKKHNDLLAYYLFITTVVGSGIVYGFWCYRQHSGKSINSFLPENEVFKFSFWGFLPTALIAYSLFVIKKHNDLLTYYLYINTVIGSGIIFGFWRYREHSKKGINSFLSENEFFKFSFLEFLPILLIALPLFLEKKYHDTSLYILLAIILVVGAFILRFQRYGDSSGRKFRKLPEQNQSIYAYVSVLIIVVFLWFFYSTVNQGTLWWEDNPWTSEAKILTKITRNWAFADLSQIKSIKGAGSDRRSDRLNWLNFEHMRLEGANFASTNLTNWSFSGSSLKNANFDRAILNNTNFLNANLERAKFTEAILKGATLSNAQLKKADLIEANLQLAVLTFANLQGANLQGANLYGTKLWGTNLQLANLRGAEEIIKEQLKWATNWQLAFYDPELIRVLGLPENHSDRVKQKDLSDYPLESANLQKADLENAILRTANLESADLTDANLREADLREAVLSNAIIKRANLKNANIYKADLSNADLQWADFREVQYITKEQVHSAKNWELALFSPKLIGELDLPEGHNDRIINKNFSKYVFENADLPGVDLQEIDFRGAKLQAANLETAIMRKANLDKANLLEANLKGANLQEASFKETLLEQADLQFADLRQTKGLTKGQLQSAKNYKLAYYDKEWINKLGLRSNHNYNLRKQYLKGYDFKKADLRGADLGLFNLENVNLQDANLQVANLIKANLKQADLQGANLQGADLQGADLQYADLQDTKNIEVEQIRSAINWKLANYSPEFIEKLDLDPDHNNRVAENDFSGYSFAKSDMRKADFGEANFRGAVLEKTDLQYADLRDAKAIDVDQLRSAINWKLAYLSENLIRQLGLHKDHNKRLSERNFSRCKFPSANLSKADFKRATLFNADLSGADLQNANIGRANLKYADLRGANLQDANLANADLQHADLQDAENIEVEQIKRATNWKLAYYSPEFIKQLDLDPDHNECVKKKDFRKFSFVEADMMKADLRGAILQGVELTEANLQKVNLRNANLEDANFEKADLRGADFRGANLTGTNFMGADLRNIFYTDCAQFKNVETLYLARCDKSLMTQLESDFPFIFRRAVHK